MEYDKLIRDAWVLTWRYRFLWILAVLAGGGVGAPAFNGFPGASARSSSPPSREVPPRLAEFGQIVAAWALANVGLLMTLGILLAALLMVLLVVSFVARGGMAQATADLATGRPSSLGRAWSSGVHLFWRFVGLWLVLVVAATAVAALMAAVVGAVLGVYMAGAPDAGIALGTLIGLPLVVVLMAAGLCVSIIVAFAQRAIAVEDLGPIEALRSGYGLMRVHLGESALTWLINFGLGVACGVACLVGFIATLIVLAALGVAVFAMSGVGTFSIAYLGVGGVLLLLGGLLVSGISNAFFWNYWTLAYLKLRGRATVFGG
jgi:hypothetical protein